MSPYWKKNLLSSKILMTKIKNDYFWVALYLLKPRKWVHYGSGASTLETKGKKRFFSNGIDTLYGATYMSWAYQLASINCYNLIFCLSPRLKWQLTAILRKIKKKRHSNEIRFFLSKWHLIPELVPITKTMSLTKYSEHKKSFLAKKNFSKKILKIIDLLLICIQKCNQLYKKSNGDERYGTDLFVQPK